jgi:hypothetical protein
MLDAIRMTVVMLSVLAQRLPDLPRLQDRFARDGAKAR